MCVLLAAILKLERLHKFSQLQKWSWDMFKAVSKCKYKGIGNHP